MGSIQFAENKTQTPQDESEFWDILIADDEAGVHEMTRLVLKNFSYNQKKLRFTSVYTGKDAIAEIKRHPDTFALILLDVIMESDDAGLQVAQHIREELHNDEIRIILRTGQPGNVPEQEVVEKYDINDYKEKTDLTSVKLYTLMRTSLKSYEAVILSKEYAHKLELQVAQEVAKNREQEKMMIIQSKQAAVGEALSMIAHQWRQPLAVISASANNILIDIQLGEANLEDLERHMQSIVNEVIDLSNTIDHFQKYFLETKSEEAFSLNTYLEEISSLFELFLEKMDVALIKELDHDIDITFSKAALSQVFVNIVKNAVDVFKARQHELSSIKRQVVIKSHVDDTLIVIDFIDNAGGVDLAIMEQIFDPYFTTKENYNRVGLGLYLSKIIIEEQMKGQILAENTSDGCCFSVRLPRKII